MASVWRAVLVAAVLAMVGLHRTSAQARFNYWGRCTDAQLSPGERIPYCMRVLDEGGGANSEISVLVVLGGAYRDLRDYSKAIEFYNRAIAYESRGTSRSDEVLPSPHALVAAYGARAQAYALTGQRDLAMADAEAVFRLVPDDATAFALRCQIRAMMKMQLDAALADCSEAAKRKPRDSYVLDASGFVQFRLGHWKEAAADYDAALEHNSKLAGSIYMRGIIKVHEGDAAGGNSDMADAKRMEPAIADRFAAYGVTP
jgi:tetratricopeptide (TPR) repeat protein